MSTETSRYSFVPPAIEGVRVGALDSATDGATMLDAYASTPAGRNFLAHALVQLARDGWLRINPDPDAAWEPIDQRPTWTTPIPADPIEEPEAPSVDWTAHMTGDFGVPLHYTALDGRSQEQLLIDAGLFAARMNHRHAQFVSLEATPAGEN